MKLAEMSIADPDLYLAGVPYDRFARLRREAPVSWHEEKNGRGFWAITRHADAIQVMSDAATFSSERGGIWIEEYPPDDLRSSREGLIDMDPPRHTRYRGLVSKGFVPRLMQAMEPYARELVTGMIDRVEAKGGCDFVNELAGDLPLKIILHLLGVPAEDQAQVTIWAYQFLLAADKPKEEVEALVHAMFGYAQQLAAGRRQNPREDVLGALMAAEINGEKLSDFEFGLFFSLLLSAGTVTTHQLISQGMLTLLERPEERRRLEEDPSLIPSAVEEMLRFSPAVSYMRRTATRDLELHGQRIAEGDKVVAWLVSANRDEEVFSEPDRFDVGRTPNEHLSFGRGPHYCLGASLARLEARVAFEEILRRLPGMELSGPVTRLHSNWLLGLAQLPVRW
ncbi:cytochrome P450 [Chondromyces apiculatus]|uniref:Putative cytochrome P450 hydroxylase n=1 Tax=Chondromyces apiculatus DSM 436 TaxID=1192034 RepID=A0A017TFM9_9BACT|nr:cytochrome P450 [Chondromyces apiculatus]EYF08073.1 putative cytochrome P450 hydroxylase [Chondromyces apiculatus DSM 436]